MKTIYICSRLKNGPINRKLTNVLESKKHKVHLPERDTPQFESSDKIFDVNLEAIRRSDIFLAVLRGGGLDFGFEVGYAYAIGKHIIGFTEDDSYKDDPMLARAITRVFYNIKDLEEALR